MGIPPEQSLETAKAIKVKTDGEWAGFGWRRNGAAHFPAAATLLPPASSPCFLSLNVGLDLFTAGVQ